MTVIERAPTPMSEWPIPGLQRELTGAQELALLARILEREGFGNGYSDRMAGHLTYRQPDGRILTNPFGMPWSELTASDVAVADVNGNQLEGKWRIHPAATLHFALHRVRNAVVTVHNHPQWATIWADHHRVPPVYDQTSAKVRGEIAVVHEYEGAVLDTDICERVVQAMGAAEIVLLAHHGVLLMGESIGDALVRCLAIEGRARCAWHVEALGGQAEELPEVIRTAISEDLERNNYAGVAFAALARRELRLDPGVLD